MTTKPTPFVIATGGWPDTRKTPCLIVDGKPRKHSFRDISKRASGRPGEWLITSRCQHCGATIIDCPTIYA